MTESKTSAAEDYQSLITVTVSDGTDEVSVCGTQFGGEESRIVRIDGHRIEAVPHGHMLVVRNKDEPGTIGFIGSALGEAEINIAGMFNGRETIGGEALSIYNLDEKPAGDLIDRLNDDSRIIETTYVALGGQ